MRKIILAVVLASLLFTGQVQAATTADLQDQYRQTLIQLIQLLMKQVELLQAQLLIAQQKELTQGGVSAIQTEPQKNEPTNKPLKPYYVFQLNSFKPTYDDKGNLSYYDLELQFADKNYTDDYLRDTLRIYLVGDYCRGLQQDGFHEGCRVYNKLFPPNPFVFKFKLEGFNLPTSSIDKTRYYIDAVYKGETYRIQITQWSSERL